MKVEDCGVVDLPTFGDERGKLTFAEQLRHVPFEVRRAFWIHGVPEGAERGAHAHKACHQFLVCLAGSVEVELQDGTGVRAVRLDRASVGLHIPPMIWASQSFGADSVLLVFASDPYDEADYHRDHAIWLDAVRSSS